METQIIRAVKKNIGLKCKIALNEGMTKIAEKSAFFLLLMAGCLAISRKHSANYGTWQNISSCSIPYSNVRNELSYYECVIAYVLREIYKEVFSLHKYFSFNSVLNFESQNKKEPYIRNQKCLFYAFLLPLYY